MSLDCLLVLFCRLHVCLIPLRWTGWERPDSQAAAASGAGLQQQDLVTGACHIHPMVSLQLSSSSARVVILFRSVLSCWVFGI